MSQRPALLRIPVLLGLLLLSACGGSDVNNASGRALTVAVSPATVTLAPGGSQLFSATVTGTRNTGVTWSVLGTGSGSFLGLTGAYTAPALPGTYTVVATSAEDKGVAGLATVTVSGGTGLSISPGSAVVSLSRTVQLSALSTDPVPLPVTVTWSVNKGGAGGSISTQGLYVAPATLGVSTSSQLDWVTASLASNPTVTATVPILVSPVVVDPDQTGIHPGGTLTFTAQPTAGVTGGVTWTAQYFSSATATPLDVSTAIAAVAGSAPPAATFTAPGYSSGFYKVRATSVSYPGTFGEGIVTIQ